jgi:methyl-accepting chemotaxis protein
VANLTIGKKLFLGTGELVLFTFALGVVAIVCINDISGRLHSVVDSSVRKQTISTSLSGDIAELIGITRAMVIRGMVKDDEAQEKNVREFDALTLHIAATLDAMSSMNLRPESRQNLHEIQETMASIVPAKEAILSAYKAGDVTGALSVLDDTVLPAQQKMDLSIKNMLDVQNADLALDTKAAAAAALAARSISVVLLLFTLLVAAVVGLVVRQTNQILHSSVIDLADSSDQIAAAASQVSSSSQSLAQGSSEQAATIEETSSASIEINSMAQRNTENSRQTAEIVTQSAAGVERANNSLSEMVVAMEGISSSSSKISKIIKVIDEIAFQTNILALNAAVEAARAGEAGMGFAVVADEVRSLAQRCAQAAKDTTDLIEDSIQKSDGGRVKVDQVALAIREITGQSSQIKTLVDEINLGSIEQSRGIDQISNSIAQMEKVTQSSAANAEETAAAAEELSAQARSMKDIVARLRSMVQSDAETRQLQSPVSASRSKPGTLSSLRSGASSNPKAPIALKLSVKHQITSPRAAKPVAAGAASFPMNDDFKEF